MARHQKRKVCFVDGCGNNSINNSNKLFVTVPVVYDVRVKWYHAINKREEPPRSCNLYCCEDHFDLPNDVENWTFFKMFGRKLMLKKNVVPHIFPPNEDSKSQITEKEQEQKRKLLEDFKKGVKRKKAEVATSAAVPKSSADNTLLPSLLHNIPNIKNHTIIIVRDDLNQQNPNYILGNSTTNSASLLNKKEPVIVQTRTRSINSNYEPVNDILTTKNSKLNENCVPCPCCQSREVKPTEMEIVDVKEEIDIDECTFEDNSKIIPKSNDTSQHFLLDTGIPIQPEINKNKHQISESVQPFIKVKSEKEEIEIKTEPEEIEIKEEPVEEPEDFEFVNVNARSDSYFFNEETEKVSETNMFVVKKEKSILS